LLNKFRPFISLKGIWIPISVSILFIIVSFAAKSEEYLEIFQPIKSIGSQYAIMFFFSCLPLYFINKINFNYINSQFNIKRSLTNRLKLLLSLSTIITILSSIIGFIVFLIYDIPFSEVHLFKITSYTFLNAFFYSILFNYLLSIRNSMGFLFLIYFLPTIETIGSYFSRMYNFDLEKFFPLFIGANDDNVLVIIVLLLVFTLLSIKSHKTYYL